MAKGQKRSNRETKKPKMKKETVVATPLFERGMPGSTATSTGKKKKG